MEQVAKAFMGELDVEDGAFECMVNRLVHRPDGVIFEFSCFDAEGGAHSATGRAVRDLLGRYRTEEFRVRYATDKTDTPAALHIERVEIQDGVLLLKGVWSQAGESFEIEGELAPLVR